MNLLLQLEAPELILLLHVELLLLHVTSVGASVARRQGLLSVLIRDQCAALLLLQSLLLHLLLLKQLLFSLWSRRLTILFLRWQERVGLFGLQGVGRDCFLPSVLLCPELLPTLFTGVFQP